MTPTKSSYTTDRAKTGYTESQTINPQELDLWRVISINGAGTVDVISEDVSSTEVYFQGLIGYQNLVGYLNVLASQYENSKYTKGSRHFGYNGQTEYITDTSKFTTTTPWTCSTGESCNPVESQGGGDNLYIKDYNLVKNSLDNDNNYSWIASRVYSFSNYYYYVWHVLYISPGFQINYYNPIYTCDSGKFVSGTANYPLRPIVTLKSGLKYTGSGTEGNPYKLSN